MPVPSLLLSKSDECYMEKCAKEQRFAFGIIIGQHAEPEKYVVLHLAKNSEEEDLSDDDADQETTQEPQKIDDINVQLFHQQWGNAIKMLPGSFQVLGAFISSEKDIVSEEVFKSAKKILNDIQEVLQHDRTSYNNFLDDIHKNLIFLAYTASTKTAVCKLYTHNKNGGTFSPMEVRVVEKPFEWHEFETNYEIDDIWNIINNEEKINIETHYQRALMKTKMSLLESIIFIQNETVDDDTTLESYIKLKSKSGNLNLAEGFKVSIYIPESNPVFEFKASEFSGTIRLFGTISSRIWCNPKTKIGLIKLFVCEDIMRSLYARVQVYCDGLTEPNISTDKTFIGEPPRRIYFNAPDSGNTMPVQFSEYIFRGEAPMVAVAQAKHILDLDIGIENILPDVEGIPEDDTLEQTSADSSLSTANETAVSQQDNKLKFYLIGFGVAVGALLLSFLIPYIVRY